MPYLAKGEKMGFKNLLNVLGIASEEYENEEYSISHQFGKLCTGGYGDDC